MLAIASLLSAMALTASLRNPLALGAIRGSVGRRASVWSPLVLGQHRSSTVVQVCSRSAFLLDFHHLSSNMKEGLTDRWTILPAVTWRLVKGRGEVFRTRRGW